MSGKFFLEEVFNGSVKADLYHIVRVWIRTEFAEPILLLYDFYEIKFFAYFDLSNFG